MLVLHAKFTAQLHTIAAWNVDMSGRRNWWVRSMKTPSLGNSTCTKIGSRAEASPA